MIKLKGFESYFFSPKDCEVYSIRKGEIKKIKPLGNRGTKIMYALYLNGQKTIISKFEIMKGVVKRFKEVEKDAF